jgi:hypothetical protein
MLLMVLLLLPVLSHPALGQDWPRQAGHGWQVPDDDPPDPDADLGVRRHGAGLGYRLLWSDAEVAPPVRPAPKGQRYRCDNPAGYYPYINACRTQWRSVSVQNLR